MATQELRERDSGHLLAESQEERVSDEWEDLDLEIVPQTQREDLENIQPELGESSNPLLNSDRPPNSSPNCFVSRCAVVASITLTLLGFELGVLNETIATLKKDQKIFDKDVDLTAMILHMIALLGSVLMGLSVDWIGRRPTILSVGALFFIGPFFMGLGSNYFWLMLGRMIAQVGVGYTLAIAPIYVAEMSPACFRGLFTSLPQAFINAGNILGHISNYFFSKMQFKWWGLMLCDGAISLVLLAMAVLTMPESTWWLLPLQGRLHNARLFLAVPESPRWLVIRGRLRDALLVLARTSKSNQEAKLQLAKIKEAAGIPENRNEDIVNMQGIENGGLWTRSAYHMLVCAIGIQILRQISGFDTILLYSPRIFEKAGFPFSDDKFRLTIGVEAVKMIFTLLASFLLDKFGRRPLLLSSIWVMVISLLTLGISLTEIDQSKMQETKDMWAHICIASLFVYTASFSIGVGPITSVYTSELFPLRLRAKGCAIAFAVNQLMSALMSLAFYCLNETLTLSGVVYTFMVATCIAWGVFFVIMPETKGRTLEEMGQYFGEFTSWHSVAKEIDAARSAGSQT